MDIPRGNREELFRTLLELNATEMMHGAYGIEGDSVVIMDALQLENLDYNEFAATVDDITSASRRITTRLAKFIGRRPDGNLSALGTLIKSNINDLISKAEDPEKMLTQVLLDMQNQLVEAKKQVAVAIADEKRLKKQWDEQIEQSKEWERKAMLAVRAGDDALAKEALSRQEGARGPAGAQFQQQWQLQKDAVEKLKDQLRTLNNKIEEAKRKKNILIARQKRAEAQQTIQDDDARAVRHQRVRHVRPDGREDRADRGRGRGGRPSWRAS